MAEAGADSGEASVEKVKSDYIRRSLRSGKGPVAFTKKGLLPLPLKKSCRTKLTLRQVRRPPKKRDVGPEAPHLLAAVPLMSAAR